MATLAKVSFSNFSCAEMNGCVTGVAVMDQGQVSVTNVSVVDQGSGVCGCVTGVSVVDQGSGVCGCVTGVSVVDQGPGICEFTTGVSVVDQRIRCVWWSDRCVSGGPRARCM